MVLNIRLFFGKIWLDYYRKLMCFIKEYKNWRLVRYKIIEFVVVVVVIVL